MKKTVMKRHLHCGCGESLSSVFQMIDRMTRVHKPAGKPHKAAKRTGRNR